MPAAAQLNNGLPEGRQGVGVDNKLGEQLPLDVRFRDENGEAVALSDIFDGERPVLLSFNYSDCPMLCTLQLNGLVTALNDDTFSDWRAGREFDVVSVSVDPLETTTRAKQSEQKYLKQYNQPGSANGFRFLTGNQRAIKRLADAAGFRFKYLPDTGEYSHDATEIVCSPEGRISRYLGGVQYDPQTLRRALVEASDGEIGTVFDFIVMSCFHYDETKGRYAPTARRIMSLGAAVTVTALAVGLIPYWLRRNAPVASQEAVSEQNNDDPQPAGAASAAAPEPIEVA